MIFEGWPSLEQNPMFYARKSHRLALTSRIISALNPALTRGNDARRPFIASYRVSIIPVIAAMKKEREKKKVKKDLHRLIATLWWWLFGGESVSSMGGIIERGLTFIWVIIN